ncbi:TPR-like protein [Rhizopogon vinicolor AM-OR11-026]|uniref:TPR-like protein n=1 Tax=Rhizopogon vinicolor AM-OR11-026 TaxID=1314800 RepID=A0A1B7MS76_9AGAM|nr:TPR-like protein [Rhizopogon vinicolor AM-OR11-026]
MLVGSGCIFSLLIACVFSSPLVDPVLIPGCIDSSRQSQRGQSQNAKMRTTILMQALGIDPPRMMQHEEGGCYILLAGICTVQLSTAQPTVNRLSAADSSTNRTSTHSATPTTAAAGTMMTSYSASTPSTDAHRAFSDPVPSGLGGVSMTFTHSPLDPAVPWLKNHGGVVTGASREGAGGSGERRRSSALGFQDVQCRRVRLVHGQLSSTRLLSYYSLKAHRDIGLLQASALSLMRETFDYLRMALRKCPPGNSSRSSSLHNLATNLQERFKQRGVLSDLDEAIELHRAALSLRPPGHSDRSSSLNNLAISLQDRFDQRGLLSDQDEAIDLHRAAVALCPRGHPDRSESLNNLAISLQDRFDQRGDLFDLDEAIGLYYAALVVCPLGHSDRSLALNNLANSLQDRFKQRGVLFDLDEAIDIHQAALALRPPGHSDRSESLNNLAVSLQDRFHHRGVMCDLDEAIDLHHQSSFLNNLAISLRDRFNRRGVLSDLDETIDLHRAALVLRPPGHSDQSESTNNFANSLRDRFKQRGVTSDLDEAIDLHRAALALRLPGHSFRCESLNNLAISLQDRFNHMDILSDLDEAIDLHNAALALYPPGHSDRSSSFNNLANSLQDRFKQRGVMSDLDEAIDLHRAALTLRPPGHSDRSESLNNLAISLQYRFDQMGVLSDQDEVIDLHRAALALRIPGHSFRSSSLNNFATALQSRFKQRGVLSDLDEAFNHYSQLSQASHAVSHIDLRASKSWIASAEHLNHSSVLTAYQTSLIFLDHWQHLAGLSSSSHHFNLVRKATSSLAMDAFSCSLRHSALTTAVELVEQGRAVFWTQLARFQAPVDQISASGDMGRALVVEFKELSFQFRNVLEGSTDDTTQIRKLTVQRDDVISRIRMLPGFSRFLLPPLFSDLQKAAQDGPVIIVNASQYSCDALIILNAQDPVHVRLDIARGEVSEWSTELQSITKDAGFSDDRLQQNLIVGILRELWQHIVSPIVTALKELIPHRS